MAYPTPDVFAGELAPPPFDPEIADVMEAMIGQVPRVSDQTLEELRRFGEAMRPADFTLDGSVLVTERAVDGPDGAPDVALTILSPSSGASALPVIFYVHGGGLVMGDRYQYLDELAPYASRSEAVVVSVEYRLAPEHPAPAQVEDVFAGLRWTIGNSDTLGIDPRRIVLFGVSAGGGLALGAALMARDSGLTGITDLVLAAPMVDDRFILPSSRMMVGYPTDRADCMYMWEAALGDARGRDEVSPYVVPARASSYAGLPRTYLDTGGVEGFRDEILSLGMRMSQDGVQVDLHLWGGGGHGFYYVAPDAAISRAARSVRDEFLARAIAPASVNEGGI